MDSHLHLAGIRVPDRQLLDRQGDHCRYGGPAGCRLDRIRRPFVCTWYLCPAQTHILKKHPDAGERLQDTLQQIKSHRRRLEERFVRAVARPSHCEVVGQGDISSLSIQQAIL